MTAGAAAIARNRGGQRNVGRQQDDFYRTPPWCTEALLRVEPGMPSGIWEPACGDGAISRVLAEAGRHVWSTDLVGRGYGFARRDFLLEYAMPGDIGGIVTNPPFKLADDFALHALERLRVPYLAMLLRLAFLEGMARGAALFTPHPPARVWAFGKRPTLWRGDEVAGTGGSIAYAWFVWDGLTLPGETRLGWCA